MVVANAACLWVLQQVVSGGSILPEICYVPLKPGSQCLCGREETGKNEGQVEMGGISGSATSIPVPGLNPPSQVLLGLL